LTVDPIGKMILLTTWIYPLLSLYLEKILPKPMHVCV